MKKIVICLFLICYTLSSTLVQAQTSKTKKEFSEAIEDNSFLIEEAYNQEPRVVQHINNLNYLTNPNKDLFYTLTQEWPVKGYKHQFSYTIPYSFLNSNSDRGIGDIVLNYRYQLFYTEDWACVAPRLSLILPTGNSRLGLGKDVVGVQFNLASSKRLSDFFALHVNAGFTMMPNVKDSIYKKTITTYNVGSSLIYLVTQNLNLMLEALIISNGEIDKKGKVVYSNTAILNPGLRFAINLKSLQIVPGFSVPINISNQKTTTGYFFYLSFEHPF